MHSIVQKYRARALLTALLALCLAPAAVIPASAALAAPSSVTPIPIADCFGNFFIPPPPPGMPNVSVPGFKNLIYATPGMPTFGTSGDDLIFGTPGPDFIDGREGDDTICGGDGNDTIYGGRVGDEGSDADQIDGENGVDTIHGETDNDVLRGGAMGDTIYGEEDSDTIYGGPGDDTIFCAGGATDGFGDWADGGTGTDWPATTNGCDNQYNIP